GYETVENYTDANYIWREHWRLQWSQGHDAVETVAINGLTARGKSASMEPRLYSRGKRGGDDNTTVLQWALQWSHGDNTVENTNAQTNAVTDNVLLQWSHGNDAVENGRYGFR